MTTLMTTLMVSAILVGTLGAAASARPAGSPWSPYRASDSLLPAGERCSFAVDSDVAKDKERIRTLETNEDGSPRVQKIVGQLVVELTNLESGASITRNLTGNGIVTNLDDGGFSLRLQGGHMLVGLGAGDAGGPGLFGLTGAGHEVVVQPDGDRDLSTGAGPVEDLCATLAAA